jgi:predicted nuclease of restriction endonuclease-like (RecB) superfamily
MNSDYKEFIDDLKSRILMARIGAARSVNRELIWLYWDIGRGIVEKQEQLGWGDSVVAKLAGDLQREFPETRGFSARNLWDMRRFFEAYRSPEILRQAVGEFRNMASGNRLQLPYSGGKVDVEFLRQLVAEIPWGHHLLILNKVIMPAARLYYLRAAAQLGWSRAVLLNQVKAGAYERARLEKKTHNFEHAMPEHLAEQADEVLKSRYNLEFLGIGRAMRERELESRLVGRLRDFLLELGYGFCFVGRQHRLVLGDKDYFVDLLFYHRFLHALVAFDLKVTAFEPEHVGKMDFYLNLLNEKERASGDNPAIGIILCAEKEDLEVAFALKTKANPIGVAEYQLQEELPTEFRGKLPTAKQIAAAMHDFLPRH